eukprot:2437543-Amphidinium_carterae.2
MQPITQDDAERMDTNIGDQARPFTGPSDCRQRGAVDEPICKWQLGLSPYRVDDSAEIVFPSVQVQWFPAEPHHNE